MSQIYSTQISPAVFAAWNYYANTEHLNQVKKNQAFLSFCHHCDKEQRDVMGTVRELTRY